MADQDILGPEQKLIADLNKGVSDLEATKHDFNVYDALRIMRAKVIAELIERLRSGTATHQELAIMVRMLKDNGLTLMPAEELPQPMEPIGFTVQHTALPSFPAEDEEIYDPDPVEELSPESDKDARDRELD